MATDRANTRKRKFVDTDTLQAVFEMVKHHKGELTLESMQMYFQGSDVEDKYKGLVICRLWAGDHYGEISVPTASHVLIPRQMYDSAIGREVDAGCMGPANGSISATVDGCIDADTPSSILAMVKNIGESKLLTDDGVLTELFSAGMNFETHIYESWDDDMMLSYFNNLQTMEFRFNNHDKWLSEWTDYMKET